MKPKLEDIGEKLSKEDIKEFEEEIEQKLPKDYKEFLLDNNGGVIKDAYYRNFYYDGDESIYIRKFFPLDEILDEPDAGENDFEKNWLAIAEDGDSSYLFLSLDKKDYGNIYFCDMVHGDIEEDALFITESFSNLINNIERERSISDIQYFVEIMEFSKLKKLIENGNLDVNYRDNKGSFLFNLVTENSPSKNEWNNVEYKGKFNESCELIKYLYNNGLNVEEIDLFCNFDIIKFILSIGYDINQKNIHGQTQLMLWSKRGSFIVVEFLLENGADKYIKDSELKTAYDYAIEGSIIDKTKLEEFEKLKEILKLLL